MPNQHNFFYQKSGLFCGLFGFIFLVWTGLVVTNQPLITLFDQQTIALVTQGKTTLLPFYRVFTTIGDPTSIVLLTIGVTVLLLLTRHKGYALWFAGTIAATNLGNYIVKNIIQRPRPIVTHLIHAGGFSYPSGHSIASMTLFIILTLLIWRFNKNRLISSLTTLIFVALPWLIGLSRIYVHVHYPSDVLGGFLFAGVFILGSLTIFKHNEAFFNL